jgi:ankyrin repeat protein
MMMDDFWRLLYAVKRSNWQEADRLMERQNRHYARRGGGTMILHHACAMGDLQLVKYIVGRGADYDVDVNAHEGLTGQRPLGVACEFRRFHLVRYLVEEGGADVDLHGDSFSSPLLRACHHGHLDTVKYLVERCDPSRLTLERFHHAMGVALMVEHWHVVKFLVEACAETRRLQGCQYPLPLHYACKRDDIALVKHLFESLGAEVEAQDNDGKTPLHWACRHGHLPLVKYLVEERRASVAAKSSDGATPLHAACEHYLLDIGMIAFLVEKGGASSVAAKDTSGNEPMHSLSSSSCHLGSVRVAKFLLSKGASVDAKNNSGTIPLHTACRNSHANADLVKWLVEAGGISSLDAKDDNGRTPLHAACETCQSKVFILVEKGAKVDATDNHGRTPLYNAIAHGNLACVSHLVTKCASWDTQDHNGLTPLHEACKISGGTELVKYLVNRFGSTAVGEEWAAWVRAVTARDSKGMTPLHYFCNNKRSLGVVTCLEDWTDATKVFDLKNKAGATPFHVACYRGHVDVVKYFLKLRGAALMAVRDNIGASPLHYACKNGHFHVVKFLVKYIVEQAPEDEKGTAGAALVGAKDKRGWMALHWACDPDSENGGHPDSGADHSSNSEDGGYLGLDVIFFLVKQMVELSVATGSA